MTTEHKKVSDHIFDVMYAMDEMDALAVQIEKLQARLSELHDAIHDTCQTIGASLPDGTTEVTFRPLSYERRAFSLFLTDDEWECSFQALHGFFDFDVIEAATCKDSLQVSAVTDLL